MEEATAKQKGHHKSGKGQKAASQKKHRHKKEGESESDARKRNPKAFAIQSVAKTERRVRRKEDITEKRAQVPTVDHTPLDPPPMVVAIVGPPKVGKSTLLKGLIRNYTKQTLTSIQGPVTIVAGKKQRITFIEVSNDLNAMIDAAKVADLALIMVDASFGFEMEVFEFLNICQVHGFPRILGVLTHLDSFTNTKTLRRTKKIMKHRFWTEVYQGAKLFYLSGTIHGEYQKTEVHNLGRFVSVMKLRPLVWREAHPYLLADRMEDITNPEDVRFNAKCDRAISLYGYVRGASFKNHTSVHIPGCGDFPIADIMFLPDPCPLPDTLKKASLSEKDKSIYAPMSGVGGIVYDKDGVYIDLGGSHSHNFQNPKKEEEYNPSNEMVASMIDSQKTLDEKMESSELKIFSESAPIKSQDIDEEKMSDDQNGRVRRKAVFDTDDNDIQLDSEDDEEEDDDDESGVKPKKSSSKLNHKNKSLLREMGLSSDEEESDSDLDLDLDDEEESESDVEETTHKGKQTKLKKSPFTKPAENGMKSKISETLSQLDKSTKKEVDSGHATEENESDDSDEELSEDEDDEEEMDEDEETERTASKEEMMKQASQSFYDRLSNTTSLNKMVYGQRNQTDQEDAEANEDDQIGGLFKVIKQNQENKASQSAIMNQIDSTKFVVDQLQNWDLDEICDSIQDCFVTGKWKESEDAEALLGLDDLDDDFDMDGDFEDLETGQVHQAKTNGSAKGKLTD